MLAILNLHSDFKAHGVALFSSSTVSSRRGVLSTRGGFGAGYITDPHFDQRQVFMVTPNCRQPARPWSCGPVLFGFAD